MDVEKLAQLSRIALTDEEVERYENEIRSILSYVDRVQAAAQNIDDSMSGTYKHHVRNVFREDVEPHERGKYTDDIVREAPATEKGYIKVKKIL